MRFGRSGSAVLGPCDPARSCGTSREVREETKSLVDGAGVPKGPGDVGIQEDEIRAGRCPAEVLSSHAPWESTKIVFDPEVIATPLTGFRCSHSSPGESPFAR